MNSRPTPGSRTPDKANQRRGGSGKGSVKGGVKGKGPGPRETPSATVGDPTGADEHVPGTAEIAWTTHVSPSTELFERLVQRHRERQRRYHRIGHVEAVLDHISELTATEAVDDLGAVVAAALYHDAVYEAQHPANERASARLARRDLAQLGWTPERAERVGSMIEGTAGHLDAPDADTAVLFDADLAILGSEPDEYRLYTTKIRDEYSHFDDGEWSAGRRSVLNGFLSRASIFATAGGRDRWEDAARTNIAAELAALNG